MNAFETCYLSFRDCRSTFYLLLKELVADIILSAHSIYSLSSWRKHHWHTALCPSGLLWSWEQEYEINRSFSPGGPRWLTWLPLCSCLGIKSVFHFSERGLMHSGLGSAECHNPLLSRREIFKQPPRLLTCKWHMNVCCLLKKEVILKCAASTLTLNWPT